MPTKAARKRGPKRGRPVTADPFKAVTVSKVPAKGGNFQRNARGLVKRVRRELGLSQTAFGRLLGKSRDAISRVELGETAVPPGLLLILGNLQKAESERRQVLRNVLRDSKKLQWGDDGRA